MVKCGLVRNHTEEGYTAIVAQPKGAIDTRTTSFV